MHSTTALLSEVEVQLSKKDAGHNCLQNELFRALMRSEVSFGDRGFRDLASELEVRLRVLKCGAKELTKGRRFHTAAVRPADNDNTGNESIEEEEPAEAVEDLKFACSATAQLRCGNLPPNLVELFSKKVPSIKQRSTEKEQSEIQWTASTNLPDSAWSAKQKFILKNTDGHPNEIDEELNKRLTYKMQQNQDPEYLDWDQISHQILSNEGITPDSSYKTMLGIKSSNQHPKKTIFAAYCPKEMLEDQKEQEPITTDTFDKEDTCPQVSKPTTAVNQYIRAGGVFSTYSCIPPATVAFPEERVRSKLEGRRAAKAAKRALQNRKSTKNTQKERVISTTNPVAHDVPTTAKSGRVKLKQSPSDNHIGSITIPIDNSNGAISNHVDCNVDYGSFSELYLYPKIQNCDAYKLLTNVKQLREAMAAEDLEYLVGGFVPPVTKESALEYDDEVIDVLVDNDDDDELSTLSTSQPSKRRWAELNEQLRDSIQKIVRVNRRFSISKISGILSELLRDGSSKTTLSTVHQFAQKQDPTAAVTPQLVFTAIVHHAHHNNHDTKQEPIKLTSTNHGTDLQVIRQQN